MDGATIANKRSADRQENDFYPTPKAVTVALLRYLDLPIGTRIWEPACGRGDMAEVMRSSGYQVTASDLYEYGYGRTGVDYLTAPLVPCDWIITNPPFKLSVEFIQRCIGHGKPFALLLKSQYWHAANKSDLFNWFRPQAVLPLTWRPDFCGLGAPTMECLWTVWGAEPASVTEYQLLERPGLRQLSLFGEAE